MASISHPKPKYFRTPAELRRWFERHGERETELWVGMYKVGSGKRSITWPEAVDEALCFGWIDGIRKSIDAESYTNRFTPRKPTSNWSAVNQRRMAELIAAGRVTPAGLAAFARRRPERSGVYSFENRDRAVLDAGSEKAFRAVPEAWSYYSAQPASYRRATTWWVVSAKRPETRARRLAQLIAASEAGEWIPSMRRPARDRPASG